MAWATAPKANSDIQIRLLEDQKDFHNAENVQQETWQYQDRDIVPASIFSVALHFGGQALGAFDGDRMVGFALSLGSAKQGHGHFHSHMVAVVPGYQNRGIGKLIKLAQRQDAIRRGVTKIVWTFDPLQIRNAHLNLSALGGVGKAYLPNLYGRTSSPLHGGIATDRLLIEWNLESPQVEAALEGHTFTRPVDAVDVQIPIAIGDQGTPVEERLSIQNNLRERLLPLLQEGFEVTGFVKDRDYVTYICSRN